MLTIAAVRTARARDRAYKLFDAGGLYLHVLPSGAKVYRLKFRLAGREGTITFGASDEISLSVARAKRDAARAQIDTGSDPRAAAVCEIAQFGNFEGAARAWHAHRLPGLTPVHAGDVLRSLERDIFPAIGAMPLAAITPPVVLAALRAIEARNSIATARRVRQRVKMIFRFAVAEGWTDHNPAEQVLEALAPAPAAGRHPAIVDAAELRRLLDAAERVPIAPVVKLASRFLALTGVRLAAVLKGQWSEIEDLDGAEPVWRVPAANMKMRAAKKQQAANDHFVPLSAAAVAVLRQAQLLSPASPTARIFPGGGGGGDIAIGEGAIGRLYDRAGYEGLHVPHGWRASFSTILNELLPEDRVMIDRALGHTAPKKGAAEEIDIKVEGAYNRSQQLAPRRRLFDAWAAILTAA